MKPCWIIRDNLMHLDPSRVDRDFSVHLIGVGPPRKCDDCGQDAHYWVLEYDTPWFYCGVCEIGG